MKIYEFSPFFNENILANIKHSEDKKWINELCLTESNKTFSYIEKSYNLNLEDRSILFHNKIDATLHFVKPGYGLSRGFPFIKFKHRKWVNESIQRNMQVSGRYFSDKDIIIFSDLDEIINPIFSDEIISCAIKNGIITIKMYHTLHYFNLLSSCGGAPDWSYRVFIMTGKFYKSMNLTIDQLRKKGERGQLINSITCLKPFMGFHHSWLGNINNLINKFRAYSHHPNEFNNKILDKDGNFDINYINNAIKNGESIFNNQEKLKILNIKLLDSVENMRKSNPNLFYEIS